MVEIVLCYLKVAGVGEILEYGVISAVLFLCDK